MSVASQHVPRALQHALHTAAERRAEARAVREGIPLPVAVEREVAALLAGLDDRRQ